MTDDLYKDVSLPHPCQNCGHITEYKMTFLETNPEVTCPKCGAVTKINADDLKKGHQHANKLVDDFKRKFGKK